MRGRIRRGHEAHVLLPWVHVVLKRCTWHRRGFGYPLVFGVAFGRGHGVRLVDGICARCTARIRRDLTRRPAPWEPPLALPAIVIGLAAVVIVLAAHSPDHTQPVGEPLAGKPSEVPVAEARRPSLVPPPQRIVYVPGWRLAAGAHPSGPAPGFVSARHGTPARYDIRGPLTGMGAQAP